MGNNIFGTLLAAFPTHLVQIFGSIGKLELLGLSEVGSGLLMLKLLQRAFDAPVVLFTTQVPSDV